MAETFIQKMSIRNSWKSIFPLTPQHFGDMMERILCFLDRSGTIFGSSSVFGQFTHSVFIGTHDQLILAVWCVVCERKCGTLILQLSPSSCTRCQWRWTRFIGLRVQKSHWILIISRASLPANVQCAVILEKFSIKRCEVMTFLQVKCR